MLDSNQRLSKYDVIAQLVYFLNDLSDAQLLMIFKKLFGNNLTDFVLKQIIDLNDEQRLNLLQQFKEMALETATLDRRKHSRKDCLINADLFLQMPKLSNFILNLNPGGAFIETSESYSIGQEIKLAFFSPNTRKPLNLTGQVIWTNLRGMGVKFNHLSKEQLDTLKLFSERKEEVYEINS